MLNQVLKNQLVIMEALEALLTEIAEKRHIVLLGKLDAREVETIDLIKKGEWSHALPEHR